MRNVYQFKSQEQRYDEASQWIAKLDKGVTAQEQKSFQEWMAANPKNKTLLFEMAELWDKMDCLARLSEPFPEQGIQRKSSKKAFMAIAASLVIFIGTLALYFPYGHDGEVTVMDSVYQTAIGEISTVSLPDGTQITMNTNSEIRAAYTTGYRALVLDRGEVYVDVAHDASRPLRVHVRGRIIEALGTEFNVKINSSQEIELVVTDGKVLIGVDQSVKDDPIQVTSERLPSSSRVVSKQEAAILKSDNEQVSEVELEEIAVKLSWRNRNLIFRGESLEEALDEINRYTPVEIVFLDESLKKVRVAGLFKAGDVDGLLDTLRANFNITYERIDDDTILLKKVSNK